VVVEIATVVVEVATTAPPAAAPAEPQVAKVATAAAERPNPGAAAPAVAAASQKEDAADSMVDKSVLSLLAAPQRRALSGKNRLGKHFYHTPSPQFCNKSVITSFGLIKWIDRHSYIFPIYPRTVHFALTFAACQERADDLADSNARSRRK